jgi:hypothetical protein
MSLGKARHGPRQSQGGDRMTDTVTPPDAVVAALQSSGFPFQTAVAHAIQAQAPPLACACKRILMAHERGAPALGSDHGGDPLEALPHSSWDVAYNLTATSAIHAVASVTNVVAQAAF